MDSSSDVSIELSEGIIETPFILVVFFGDLDGKIIEKYSFAEKGKPEVVLLKVNNGKHDYPNDIDVYLESWSFFKRQLAIR